MKYPVKLKVFALVLTIFWGGSLLFPHNLSASELTFISRLSGATRIQTSVEIALRLNPGIAPAVVLATSKSFPDALAGIPLAIEKEAPILWVGNTPQQSKDVFDFIKGHCDKKGIVYILGSEQAIPKSFETELQAMGFKAEQIQRLGGKDRYETAAQIARKVELKESTVYITTGDNYSQAASVAVLAAVSDSPILLLPSKGSVPESVIAYLNQAANERSLSIQVIGNNSVISDAMVAELKMKVKGLESTSIERLNGNDLYNLMAKANEQVWMNQTSKEAINHIFITSGKTYVDSIPGAVLAARIGAPLIFVEEQMPQPSAQILAGIYN